MTVIILTDRRNNSFYLPLRAIYNQKDLQLKDVLNVIDGKLSKNFIVINKVRMADLVDVNHAPRQ